MRFRCSRCGEHHEGLPDVAFDAPFYYHTVPEAERERRSTLTSDFCSIDGEDYFIRGCLEIPIIERADVFAWGVWMSVSEANFERYKDVFDDPAQSHVGPFVGWLSNQLPVYAETLTLKVRGHLRDEGARPVLELEPTEHPLAVDQRNGITLAKLQEVYEATLHDTTRDP
jgi:hypothetical protein